MLCLVCVFSKEIDDDTWEEAMAGKVRCVVDTTDPNAFQTVAEAIDSRLCVRIMIIRSGATFEEWGDLLWHSRFIKSSC